MADVLSPLVPTSNTRLLETFQASKLIDDWQAIFNIDISGELSDTREIALYRCQASQLDFFMPSSAAGSAEIYRCLQKLDWYYMSEKCEFGQAIKDLYETA